MLRPQSKEVLCYETGHKTSDLTDVLVGLTMTTELSVWNLEPQEAELDVFLTVHHELTIY